MDNNKIYKINVAGPGYQVEEHVDKNQLSGILAIMTSGVIQQNNLDTSSSPSHKIQAKSRRNVKFLPTVLVRNEVEGLKFDPVSSLYGNYWNIAKKKSDKLMWILAFLNENNIDGVYQKELSFVAERLGDHIPPKSITSLLEAHKLGGRIAPYMLGTNKAIRILKPGLDYVKSLSSQTEQTEIV